MMLYPICVIKLLVYKSLFLLCLFVCSMQIFVTLAIVFGVVLYRVSIMTALHMSSTSTFRTNIRATVKTTAAIINLIIIIIMDEVYGAIARWLTVMGTSSYWFKTFSLSALLQNMFTDLAVVFNLSEVPKTDKSFEERLIFKAFILKFANAFTPIVYLAFFRGRWEYWYQGVNLNLNGIRYLIINKFTIGFPFVRATSSVSKPSELPCCLSDWFGTKYSIDSCSLQIVLLT